MCLVISAVLIVLGVNFYLDGSMTHALVSFGLASPLVLFFAWRIGKIIQSKSQKSKPHD